MFIQGPAGRLEADLTRAKVDGAITAVLCHPHPLYGGSMHDAVLDTVAAALLRHGVHCLRFNFRGVGASDGTHDEGDGEVDDLDAVVSWVGAQSPQDKIWLAGYSFGAAVVWRSLASLGAERALLVAPPVGAMPFTATSHDSDVVAVTGDRDDFVDVDKLRALPGVQVQVVPGADHFFAGSHRQLNDAIEQAISR